ALVEPLIAAHAERPRCHDQAGGDADPGEEPDGEGDLVEDGGETLEHFADGNDGDVRKGRDDRRLHAAFVFGLRARRGQIGCAGGPTPQVSTYSRERYQVSSRLCLGACETGLPLIATRRERTTGVRSGGRPVRSVTSFRKASA